jgi:hypothetical protein
MSRPHVHVEVADPLRPTSAARATASAAFGGFPRRRPLTGLLVGWADTPGLAVAPWTLRGVLDALPEGMRHSWEPLAEPRASDRALRSVPQDVRRDARALERGAMGERRVPLSIAGQRRSAAIPRAWVGSSLCVVAPLCHATEPRSSSRLSRRGLGPRASGPAARGPVELVLAAIARRCGMDSGARAGNVESHAAMVRAGSAIVADTFCDAWLILDGTWWAALKGEHAGGEPAAVEHCLGSRCLIDTRAATAVDDWLGELLGHPRRTGTGTAAPGHTHTPRISGRRRQWPTTTLPRPPSGSPRRALDALWRPGGRERRADPPSTRRALTPAPPGRFADHWTRWRPDGGM